MSIHLFLRLVLQCACGGFSKEMHALSCYRLIHLAAGQDVNLLRTLSSLEEKHDSRKSDEILKWVAIR